MDCPKCGSKNQEGSIFCNKCGTKMLTEDNQTADSENEQLQEELQIDNKNNMAENKTSKVTKLEGILKNKKVFIPISIICCLIVIAGIIYLSAKPTSVDMVYNKIKDYNTEDLTVYLDEVYPEGGGFLGLFEERNRENRVEVLNLLIQDIQNEFEDIYGGSISDYASVKILKVDIEYPKYSSDYVDINVTVTNEGEKSISYIKINLFFEDENGKIVKSDWTNDTSIIKPGASQVITKMTETDGWKTVTAEIADIRW